MGFQIPEICHARWDHQLNKVQKLFINQTAMWQGLPEVCIGNLAWNEDDVARSAPGGVQLSSDSSS